ncbi:RagB/SusD family nutrient uptake outer membrane protein [Mucilaginibacter gossypii]|uniref:RagB/SusD family nutrient uptake outer membrane protein n=1 Tax=Mucilaginibacter gossypii TaxID=551996 RepID=UPI000DCCDA26|nr:MULTISPECIES: RagB/SusD family nutrient uptake outer membrane protein [Mucilaginibacter]QTE39637.1 RagB/SusD family nutrient uptake outer membrane protein [Mucilaginibacter gossypii]RAV54014.1 RagB/SusD family nutrient uptake outer membrane protein [Mucilaginibacter rubeus]
MKKNILIMVVGICFLSACLSSCNYLNKKPDNLLTSDLIWSTRANAESYLYNIYGYIKQTDGGDYSAMGASDESSVSIPGTNVRQMVVGNWSPVNAYFDYWDNYYTGIRSSFIFEANIDKVPATQLSVSLKNQYKAEARFLRGWFYWQLMKQYGPVVKVTETLSLNDDFNKYPRASFDECKDYVNQLMDQAASGLPAQWPSTSNYGRPTKGACLAVKAQLALLSASPLWNGNPSFASFKNQDGTPLAPTVFDAGKWKIAADAAKAVIDLGSYKLFTNLDNGGTQFDPYLSVRDLFLTNWNSEIIFSRNSWNYWGYTKCVSPGPGGYSMYNATQNVVDAFYMNNGRTIDDPLSGYTATSFAQSNGAKYWEHSKGQWNMYANREPRFYAYIQYNGRPVLPAPTVDDKNYYSSAANIDGTGRVEFYYNGKAGAKASGASNNITGYDVLKNVSPADNIRMDATNYRPFILIRYAEILLDYVEALNEYDPSNPNVVLYLDQIRTRAGLPGIETVYPGAVGNKDLMRKYILRERQVELCFESDRYFTLVRRLLLGADENQTIYGLNVNTDDQGLGFAFTGLYNKTLFQKRVWNNKMYLFPISQYQLDRDRALVQNPGW